MLKYFNNESLGDYHDLYGHNDTLLIADVFDNFRNKFVEIYELDPAHFISIESLFKKKQRKNKLEVEYVMQYISMQKQIIST